ncbi:dioxygenase family protein [Dermatobacter hominis]|uniref:dioxygenase family protein n=1 Tax=Dermatobacter hominis TaxID=2884263 RepID=UPI001D1220C1|nr:hypothetical protein [Dermatobacter hominis]UDY34088.1 hypothetical protein LH044_12120 [Dermatobacter hominis]
MGPAPGVTDRRRFLLGAGAAALAAGAAACSGDDGAGTVDEQGSGAPSTTAAVTTAPGASPPTALTAADFDDLEVCRLLPEQTAGPFPLDEQFDRSDVTEGRPGHPMRLGLRVVDADCAPVPGALVEIWHADASGDYSAFRDGGGGKDEADGTTFLRGTQAAGVDGIAEFTTIYPGWYRGRAVHVHVRVHRPDEPGALVLTSHLYFPEGRTEEVVAEGPYAEFGLPDTSNEDDAIAGDPGSEGTLLATSAADTAHGPGTLALANLGVDLR